MKIEEILALTEADIKKKILEEREALSGLEFQKAVGQIQNNSQFKKIRKTIAQLNTILRQRETAAKK